ncbi:hypothetical protein SAMN04488018_11257 [Myroides marinus]|uniref:C1q domain-containing protein n=1 Tax=Myroides marinus TaxID=703342 RepID=A0A1H6WA71_9FLAO|nr:hypothetical protein [Myroides marinus]SEJ10947.1 hypothetical protein SAMN04488018_11257 [Myroides marinus]
MRGCVILCCFFYSLFSFGQVGINVPIPLEALHIDGSKNNPVGVKPSVDQAKDDFVITKEGNVGLGTFEPKAKLDIEGKMRIVDGNEGNSKVMMSDAVGNLKWQSIPYIVPTVLGQFESGTARSDKSNTGIKYIHSKGYITLSKGRWIVNAGLTLVISANQDLWLQAILSSSKTSKEQIGFRFQGNAGNNTAYASRMKVVATNYSLLSGSSVIDVTADTVTLYLMIDNLGDWSFSSGSWENYFYAIPVL